MWEGGQEGVLGGDVGEEEEDEEGGKEEEGGGEQGQLKQASVGGLERIVHCGSEDGHKEGSEGLTYVGD